MKDGKVAYIEGNRDHPVNKGVLCAKGSSGIMQVTAPSRLRAPMKRVGPRGSGEFVEISWEEALSTAVSWMAPLRKEAPEKLAFFTGRDQSQSFTSFFAQAYGTPNYAAHGGFCSVNMAAAGIYTIGGAFWEFGQPDWDYTKLFVLFGVAEDHDSNPIKMGIGKIKTRGAKVVGVNPIRSGYNAVADDWFGITPGTDGLLILSLIHELLRAGKVDVEYLAMFTNAPGLVNSTEGPDKGLLLRDADNKMLVVDKRTGKLAPFDQPGVRPDLGAVWEGHRTAFQIMAEKYLAPEYAPEAVAERTGISAERIKGLAADMARVAFDEAIELGQPWTDFRGEKHEKMIGRPVSFHSMRGISAHSNGFQTARALHLLQVVLGTVEVPGGFRFKPPYPKPFDAHPVPHCKVTPGAPLDGPHLGYPRGPEHLALKEDGSPARIDKAFSWENPLSAHGLMHMVISNAHAGVPYKIDTLLLYMANMAWNSTMNTRQVIEMLTDKGEDGEYVIPRIIYSDAYSSEMVAYADLILPDTTYLERHDCISLLDRPICEADGAADAIRWPVIEPDRNVRGFQSVLLDLGARLGLPGFVTEDGAPKYKDYADYIVNHQRRPGVGPLAGFRGDGTQFGRGEPNPDQMQRYIDNGGFAIEHVPHEGLYYKPWNRAIRQARAVFVQRLFGTDAAVPTGRRRAWRPSAAGPSARAVEDGDGPAACVVRAVWRCRGRGLPHSRADAATHGDVSLVGLAKRVAAPVTWAQSAVFADQGVGGAWLCRGRLGKGDVASWVDHGAGGADGGVEREYDLDVERNWQAQGCLGVGARRAGSDQGVLAEPPDPRIAAAEGGWIALDEL